MSLGSSVSAPQAYLGTSAIFHSVRALLWGGFGPRHWPNVTDQTPVADHVASIVSTALGHFGRLVMNLAVFPYFFLVSMSISTCPEFVLGRLSDFLFCSFFTFLFF